MRVPCRTLSPGVTDEERADPAYQFCPQHCSKGLSADGVYHLGPAWGFVVSIHGNSTQGVENWKMMSVAQGGPLPGVRVPALPQGWP